MTELLMVQPEVNRPLAESGAVVAGSVVAPRPIALSVCVVAGEHGPALSRKELLVTPPPEHGYGEGVGRPAEELEQHSHLGATVLMAETAVAEAEPDQAQVSGWEGERDRGPKEP